jgi:hypothetical protein
VVTRRAFLSALAPLPEAWRAKAEEATALVRGNIRKLHTFPEPVLVEGARYPGIWLECGPHEALIWAQLSGEVQVAEASHRIFYHYQKEDGQLPYSVKADRTGFSQIQMVVPIAATALDTFKLTRSRAFLEESYRACSRWDGWLIRYRDRRGQNLVELFCEYDTGHDNSARLRGLPKQCPGLDAKNCPDIPGMPWLAPDLSATLFGGRVALAEMASILGDTKAASEWRDKAEATRRAILDRLFVRPDAAFYDLKTDGSFVKMRHDAISRVVGEHVVDQSTFDLIWKRQLGNPKAFWSTYPLPSAALDEPLKEPDKDNCWGGPSQALTAMRTPRWMPHYGRTAEHRHLLRQWLEAQLRAGGFFQQMNPETGVFLQDKGAYTPSALTFLMACRQPA